MINPKLCIRCKGKLLCGLQKCPLLEALKLSRKVKLDSRQVEAETPPLFLVSWKNYPKVAFGPYLGPVSLKDEEFLYSLSLDQVFELRLRALRAYKVVGIREKLLEEASLSIEPVLIDAELKSRPKLSLKPKNLGFSAPAKKLREEDSGKVPFKVEKVLDERAENAIIKLRDMPFFYLVQLLSTGALGFSADKKLVPTRWAITAVDSILSRFYFEKIKDKQEINSFFVAHAQHWDNNFVILFLPMSYAFEVLETWLPSWSKEPVLEQDYEFFELRKDYARNVTGSYYAARHVILRFLAKIKRKAGVVVFREVGPSYYFPVGVWHVRKTVEEALKNIKKFSTLDEAFEYANLKLNIPVKRWPSKVLKHFLTQRKLLDYVKS